jgi:hypothetical protein
MTPAGHDLVHFNLAFARYPLDHPSMAGFADQLETVNRLAENSPGFLWTAADGEAGDAAAVFGNPLVLANISTWQSVQDLWRFVYEGLHGRALTRRREWFETLRGPAYVLWWATSGARPNWLDARDRLEHLEQHGPAPYAFTFKHAFRATGEPAP